jgi:signal transduction histidine kinase
VTTALGKVVRTTAFKLSAIYIAVFSVFSVFFIVYIAYSTNVLLNQQVRETIGTELVGLSDQYRVGGLSALIDVIDQRAHQPGASLYLMTDADGHILAGNVSHVTGDIAARTGIEPITVTYHRSDSDAAGRTALVQVVSLPGDFLLLVGRDIGEREEFRGIITSALAWALVLMIGLALISYLFVSRRVLKRIDTLSAGARRIMLGDLTGRLDVTGSGDEFDRLAESLNAMLDRIEHLLYGVKDVSDNIAHDLKTPLTRLRNRVEAALSGPPDPVRDRATLEATIEESDQLIGTFNALLSIARVEAGSTDGGMTEVEASAIVDDVAELYEPVADETGVELTVETPQPITLKASRELLGQAVANLIDNALKHGRPDSGPARVKVSTAKDGEDLVIRVADNGNGIPEADRERALQRFVRLEKSRSQPGSGLGLSLAAAVARLHNGAIELGDANPGLAVTLRLPIHWADGAKSP